MFSESVGCLRVPRQGLTRPQSCVHLLGKIVVRASGRSVWPSGVRRSATSVKPCKEGGQNIADANSKTLIFSEATFIIKEIFQD